MIRRSKISKTAQKNKTVPKYMRSHAVDTRNADNDNDIDNDNEIENDIDLTLHNVTLVKKKMAFCCSKLCSKLHQKCS